MSKVKYKRKPYVTYTVHYEYLAEGEWKRGKRVSYAQSSDAAIEESHDPDRVPVARYEGFHVAEVERVEH